MTCKFSVCLLPLLALALLLLLGDVAAGDCFNHKQCGACTAATGSPCQWCFFQIKKITTSSATSVVNTGLGFCISGGGICPPVNHRDIPFLKYFFPYVDSTGATHALEIKHIIATADCAKNPGGGVDAAKDSPLDYPFDRSKAQCKDCTGNKKWCQFDQYLDRAATPPKLYSGKSGGVCLHAVSGTTYSVDCSKFKAMMDNTAGAGITVADVASGDCAKVDTPTCTADNCEGCITNRCLYCNAVLKTTTTPTGGGTATIAYKTKDLGVCKPLRTNCPTSFGTLSTVTDYTTGAKAYEMEVKPFGRYFGSGPTVAHCTTVKVDRKVETSNCASCVAQGSKWCNVELSKATYKALGGFCTATSAATVCSDFTKSASTGVYAATATLSPTCQACDGHMKCGDCKGQSTCEWCAAKVGTNDINLGYCTDKGSSTTQCDKTKFGSLDGLLKAAAAAGKTFAVAPKGTGTCASTKDSPLVMASKTCNTCAPGNTWCKLGDGTNLGGVCLKTGATAATHSTDCATLKTSLGMTTDTAVTATANCPKPCDTYTKCSDCGPGCEWCVAKVGTNDIKLGYCEKKGTPTVCDPNKFGTLVNLNAAGKTFTVAPKGTGTCPSTKDSPLVMASKTCKTCAPGNAWCNLGDGTNSGGVCLLKTATAATHSTDCTTLKTSFGMTTELSVTAVADCPACGTYTKCSDCKAGGTGCDWCDGRVGGTSTKLGYCTTKGTPTACEETKFGTLDALLHFAGEKLDARLMDKKGCPAATAAKDSPLETAKDCTSCTAAANTWCQLGKRLGGTGNHIISSGGVCLNSVANPSTTCPTLSTQLSMVNKMTTATANCPKPDCSKKSCDGCLTEGCMWCGVTVDNGEGTALGKCVSMPTTPDNSVCNGQTFGKMKDVLGYKVGSKIYKMEVVPFSLTKGWTEAQCNKDEVDATILPDCKKCIANKEKWCKVVLTDNKNKSKEGGICLGKNETSAKKICSTFTQVAKKNEAYKRNGTLTAKCDGAVQNSLSLGLLFAAVALSLLSSF